MAVNAKTQPKSGGGDFVKQEALDAATYPCRVVQSIYFGMQEQRPYKGTDKPPKDEIGYTYEFLDEFMLDEDGNEIKDKPRWISEIFPAYNLDAEKAKSTQRLKALDPDDNLDGEFLAVVGLPCLVTITKEKKGDEYKNYVSSVSAMRDKDIKKAGDLVGDPVAFDVDNPDREQFDKFPEWIQDKLKSHLGYQGSALQAMLEGGEDEADEDVEEKPKKKDKKKKKKAKKDEEW